MQIDGVARWRASSDVAARYSDGRVFLVGDAAHVMPPNGGFGGNTGIHDAYDLAWKLAWAVRGEAGSVSSPSYSDERRPVGRLTVEQAYTRYVTRTATYLGATDYQPLVADLEIELGYVYGDDETVHEDPRTTLGMPGTRAPHLWIERDGRRISTLDLFGTAFVVLASPRGRAWLDAAADARGRSARRSMSKASPTRTASEMPAQRWCDRMASWRGVRPTWSTTAPLRYAWRSKSPSPG